MKKKEVSLDEILLPGESEYRDEDRLRLYHRMYDEGCDEVVDPIIVTSPGPLDEYKKQMDEYFENKADNPMNSVRINQSIDQRQNEAEHVFQKVEEYGLWLLDGTHRSIAATLNGREHIDALEVEEDSDIQELEQMIQSGELINFPHSGKKLDEMRESFLSYAMGYTSGKLPPKGVTLGTDSRVQVKGTVKDYFNTLIEKSEGEEGLPNYMIENIE